MKAHISELTIEGRDYLVIPKALIEQEAPQLLKSAPRVPDKDATPWAVLKRHMNEGVSLMEAWRDYLGLTQQEVADRVGVTQAAYAQYEQAEKPRKKTREKVAAALGLSVEQLS